MSVVNVNRADNFEVTEGTLKRFWCQMGERFREQKEREMKYVEDENGGIEAVCPKGVMEKCFPISSAAVKGLDTLTKWESGEIPTPQGKKDGGQEWIEWKGGECPIPWAGAGEFDVLFGGATKSYVSTVLASVYCWGKRHGVGSIVAYRLTDGWVPVVDGKCPEVAKGWKAGEFEVKFSDASTLKPCLDTAVTSSFRHKAVALRRIPSAQLVEPSLTSEEAKLKETVGVIQKELEGISDDIREIYRPLSQNEVMRIAGEAINGTRVGEVVTVGREVLATLRKDWN